jgi:predicted ribosome quality control (RQC) complex YloA/Tae2 family protein
MNHDLQSLKKIAWVYCLDENFVIIAGRTDKDNEFLSLRLASQNDWWFHVHSVPGSHVLLRSLNNIEPSKSQIETAAAVAAYHSKAKKAGVVPVTYTQAGNVSKPRGTPVGTVRVRPALPDLAEN